MRGEVRFWAGPAPSVGSKGGNSLDVTTIIRMTTTIGDVPMCLMSFSSLIGLATASTKMFRHARSELAMRDRGVDLLHYFQSLNPVQQSMKLGQLPPRDVAAMMLAILKKHGVVAGQCVCIMSASSDATLRIRTGQESGVLVLSGMHLTGDNGPVHHDRQIFAVALKGAMQKKALELATMLQEDPPCAWPPVWKVSGVVFHTLCIDQKAKIRARPSRLCLGCDGVATFAHMEQKEIDDEGSLRDALRSYILSIPS